MDPKLLLTTFSNSLFCLSGYEMLEDDNIDELEDQDQYDEVQDIHNIC